MNDEFKLYKYIQSTGGISLDTSTTIIPSYEITSDYTYIETVIDKDTNILFNCHMGICYKSIGYLKDGEKGYTNASGSWVELTTENKACTAIGHVGNVNLATTLKLCIPENTDGAPNPVKEVIVGDDVYFLGSGTSYKLYNSAGTNTMIATLDLSDGYYLVKDDKIIPATDTDSEGKFVECKNKFCTIADKPTVGFYLNARGGPMISCAEEGSGNSKTTKCKLRATSGYYMDNKSNLVLCDGTSCAISDFVGYFKNADTSDTENPYIQCSYKGCAGTKSPTEGTVDCKSDAQISKLTSDNKVCLSKDQLKTDTFNGTPGPYLISYSSSSIFKTYISKSSYFGIVDVTANTIALKFGNSNSVYCVVKATLVASAGACSDANVTAGTHETYICNVDGVCIPEASTDEVLPESIRGKKDDKDSDEEVENTSAADLKIECDVISGKNCKYSSIIKKTLIELIGF